MHLDSLPEDIMYSILRNLDNPFPFVHCNKKINKLCTNIGYIKKVKINWNTDMCDIIKLQIKHFETITDMFFVDIINPEEIIICKPIRIYFENCIFNQGNIKLGKSVLSLLEEIQIKYFSYREIIIDLHLYPKLNRIIHCKMTHLKFNNFRKGVIVIIN